MKNLFQKKTETILGLFFGSCLILSFVGGCSAKLAYQMMNNNPGWLNNIVVAMFVGLFFCSWGTIGVLASRKLFRESSFDSKIKAIMMFVLFGIPPLIFGLFDLYLTFRNLVGLW